nr:TcmI family type II polyketide cyclase [Ktedonobacteraceae bacterium]
MGYTRNTIIIEAPVDDVFRLTNNVRTWPSLFTEYQSSEVIEEHDQCVTFQLTTRPDEDGNQWSWVAQRRTDSERRSTYSERMPSSGPFERMVIRWWYDPAGEKSTIMTWEQEFTMKAGAHVSEEQATSYLNKQTKIQQSVIKERVEQMCESAPASAEEDLYRGVIVGRYQDGSEAAIAEAFKRSDETELPRLLGVKSRHVWVLGDVYLHFVEAQASLPLIIREYANHPLFKEIKAEVDTYVQPLSPDLNPGVAREIYQWTNAQ